MCGISGIYRFNNHLVSIEEAKRLNNNLIHRGPDNEGYWQNTKKSLVLGHRRLSILDLSEGGNQPMISQDKNYVIVLNGEIFNFLELQRELQIKGYQFQTQTDTEVALNAYMEWGTEAFNKFNGMWALAIYHVKDDSLILSRDRYGIKPLYYYKNAEQFIFSSEIKAIDIFFNAKLSPDINVIESLLTGSGYFHGTTSTYVKEIKNLPGGFFVEIIKNKFSIKENYCLQKVTIPNSFNEQTHIVRDLLIDAVKLRLRSDVPVATCLSGGVDSGSIASIIGSFKNINKNRFSHFSHKAFIAAFPNTPIDETKQAKKLAEINGLELEVLNIYPPTADELEAALHKTDGPMPSLAFFPIEKLYGYIRKQGIIVTLDGQGPDEMLGGYSPVYSAFSAAWKEKNIPWFFDVYRTYSAQGETDQYSSKDFVNKQFKRFLHLRWLMAQQIYRKPVKSILSKIDLYTWPEKHVKKTELEPARLSDLFTNDFDKHLFSEFFQNPLPGILNQYDRASMAHGVECRMPFMDYRLVEFIFSLPYHAKVGHGYTKRVLREAMNGILPDETRLNKIKIGFNAPIVDWYKGELKTWILDQISSDYFINNPFFNGKKTKEEFTRFLNSENKEWSDAWQIWPKIHLAWWLKNTNRL